MIDWIAGTIPVREVPHIPCDTMMKVSPTGLIKQEYALPAQVQDPSGATSIRLHQRILTGGRAALYFSGNPIKFVQGHNVYGPCEPRPVLAACLRKLAHILGSYPAGLEVPWGADLDQMKLTWVDMNHSWRAPSPEYVKQWLQHAGTFAVAKSFGRATCDGGTLYWGKYSRRIGLKMYDKLQEVKIAERRGHLPKEVAAAAKEAATGLLRVEIRVRTLWLRDHGINTLGDWPGPGFCKEQVLKRLATVSLPDNIRQDSLTTDVAIPGRLRLAYLAWLSGANLPDILPRATYYRYRSDFRKFNIDIDIASSVNNTTFSLRELFANPPVEFPGWSEYDNNGLIAELTGVDEACQEEAEEQSATRLSAPLHTVVAG